MGFSQNIITPSRILIAVLCNWTKKRERRGIKSSGAQQNEVLCTLMHRFARNSLFCQNVCVWSLVTYFNLSLIYHCIYHLYVLFVDISYQAKFCLQKSHPAILVTMLTEYFNCGSFIKHALLPETSKACILSVFLPGERIYILLLGTQWNVKWQNKW